MNGRLVRVVDHRVLVRHAADQKILIRIEERRSGELQARINPVVRRTIDGGNAFHIEIHGALSTEDVALGDSRFDGLIEAREARGSPRGDLVVDAIGFDDFDDDDRSSFRRRRS
jgi:hypothetical protein